MLMNEDGRAIADPDELKETWRRYFAAIHNVDVMFDKKNFYDFVFILRLRRSSCQRNNFYVDSLHCGALKRPCVDASHI